MKAITTKFHGPTNTRGSRYSASDGDGNQVMVSADHAKNSDDNHDAAAIALCHKMKWDGPLMRGAIRGGCVYTFDSHYNRVRFESNYREQGMVAAIEARRRYDAALAGESA